MAGAAANMQTRPAATAAAFSEWFLIFPRPPQHCCRAPLDRPNEVFLPTRRLSYRTVVRLPGGNRSVRTCGHGRQAEGLRAADGGGAGYPLRPVLVRRRAG